MKVMDSEQVFVADGINLIINHARKKKLKMVNCIVHVSVEKEKDLMAK